MKTTSSSDDPSIVGVAERQKYMISIIDNEYNSLVEVRLAGLSQLDSAILEKDLLITKVLHLLSDFDWNMFSIFKEWIGENVEKFVADRGSARAKGCV